MERVGLVGHARQLFTEIDAIGLIDAVDQVGFGDDLPDQNIFMGRPARDHALEPLQVKQLGGGISLEDLGRVRRRAAVDASERVVSPVAEALVVPVHPARKRRNDIHPFRFGLIEELLPVLAPILTDLPGAGISVAIMSAHGRVGCIHAHHQVPLGMRHAKDGGIVGLIRTPNISRKEKGGLAVQAEKRISRG